MKPVFSRLLAVVITVALSSVAALPTLAQDDTAAGEWSGTIEVPGSPLDIEISLAETDAGWSAEISIPAQGFSDVALTDVVVDGDAVSFRIPGIAGDPAFAGTRSGDEITGGFTQGGQTFPFTLTRGGDNTAEEARAALDGIDPIIEQALQDFGIPGLSIAVVAADELVFAKGYGQRNVEEDLPVTEQTLFAIGSTSKAFTAFILAILVEEGELEWDTPLVEYMPDFRMHDEYATAHLTVRDLLIHSSGLPRHDLAWYGSEATREEIFARLAHLEPSADLRQRWQYQNIMFMTAGLLAERVTGKTWETLVRERIFDPLEMSRSNFSVNDSQMDDDHAVPYTVIDAEATLVPFRNIDAVGPAGSINSSVSEMSQWMRLQLGGGELDGQRIVEEGTLREMHTPQMLVGGYPSSQRVMSLGYGMGWMLESHRGHFLAQHGGGIDGFISWVALLPMERFGVVVYTNGAGENPLPTVIGRTVIDRILGLEDGGYLDRARAALLDDEEDESDEEEPDEDAGKVEGTSPSHELADYVGEYGHDGYGTVAVTLADDQLAVEFNGLGGPLAHWHYDTFVVDDEDSPMNGSKIQFRMSTAGVINELLASIEPTMSPRVFERLPEDRLSDPEFLARFVGVYTIDPQRITIELRGDKLYGTVTGQPTFELVPSTGTSFTIREAEGFTVEFLMEEDGSVPTARFHQPNGVFDAARVEDDTQDQ